MSDIIIQKGNNNFGGIVKRGKMSVVATENQKKSKRDKRTKKNNKFNFEKWSLIISIVSLISSIVLSILVGLYPNEVKSFLESLGIWFFSNLLVTLLIGLNIIQLIYIVNKRRSKKWKKPIF